ncbi:MAG: hypothetical protein K6F35_02140 [Lachnospiraceae bacterium]|nr:hypothetical protein [Lachnospiraceae bacterium]
MQIFYDAAIQGIAQKHGDQFIPAPAGSGGDGFNLAKDGFRDPDGKDPVSVFAFQLFWDNPEFFVFHSSPLDNQKKQQVAKTRPVCLPSYFM